MTGVNGIKGFLEMTKEAVTQDLRDCLRAIDRLTAGEQVGEREKLYGMGAIVLQGTWHKFVLCREFDREASLEMFRGRYEDELKRIEDGDETLLFVYGRKA